jgi:hypothetical protein
VATSDRFRPGNELLAVWWRPFGGRAKAIGHDGQQTDSLQAAFFAPEVSADADFCSSVFDEVDCDEPEVSIGI